MNITGYLTINSNGSTRFTKGKSYLNWDEISVKLNLNIPDELFRRPLIEATINVSEDIIPKEQPTDLILNTKELIEESTGAKIEFKVIPYDDKE